MPYLGPLFGDAQWVKFPDLQPLSEFYLLVKKSRIIDAICSHGFKAFVAGARIALPSHAHRGTHILKRLLASSQNSQIGKVPSFHAVL